jgi:hypothetical protein
MNSKLEKEIDQLLQEKNDAASQSKNDNVERIKEYGKIQISKNEIVKIELISWNKKPPVLSIIRYSKEGKPIKGMQFNKEAASQLVSILTIAIKDQSQ